MLMTDMLLFLDFDGVLHPVSGSKPFQPACMEVLSSALTEYPEIRVVITSSWREEKTLTELQNYLAPVLSLRVVGVTPVIDEPFLHHVRYHEVQAYLKNTMQETTPWVAIDDEPGTYPNYAPILLTDRRHGLVERDKEKLIKLIEVVRN